MAREVIDEVAAIHRSIDSDPAKAIAEARRLLSATTGSADADEVANVQFGLSAVLIDAGGIAGDRPAIEQGRDVAAVVAANESLPSGARAQARYHIGNAEANLADIAIDATLAGSGGSSLANARFAHRDELCRVRVGFSDVAADPDLDPLVKAMALCNLGNTLNGSGRWIEAYDAYTAALAADPSNGNAAGNLAVLLGYAMAANLGDPGHLGALYDHYAAIAKANKARTLEVAGPRAADRWDQLPAFGSDGHMGHHGDAGNQYQRWIVQNRLALTMSMEGMGSDSPRWDSAAIKGITTTSDAVEPPITFAMLNGLKAEFLLARRLAFDAETALRASSNGWAQHPEDTGVYHNTLDYVVYGIAPAQLITGSVRRGRVAPARCRAGAPSEPDVPLVAASGSSKPLGRAGLVCWSPASAGCVDEAGLCAVRRAVSPVVDEIIVIDRPAGNMQPPSCPFLRGLWWLFC